MTQADGTDDHQALSARWSFVNEVASLETEALAKRVASETRDRFSGREPASWGATLHVFEGGLAGHVAWMASGKYLSLAPDKSQPARDVGKMTITLLDGTEVPNVKNKVHVPLREATLELDTEHYGEPRRLEVVDLNPEAMVYVHDRLVANPAEREAFLAYTLTDSLGNERGPVHRSNCVTWAMTLFFAGAMFAKNPCAAALSRRLKWNAIEHPKQVAAFMEEWNASDVADSPDPKGGLEPRDPAPSPCQ